MVTVTVRLSDAIRLTNIEGTAIQAATDRVLEDTESITHELYIPDQQAATVGRVFYVVDSELRRAVRALTVEEGTSSSPGKAQSDDKPKPPRPVGPGEGGLEIRAAAAGESLIADIAPYGAVAAFLLSDPVQFALTVQSLWANVRWVIVRVAGQEVLNTSGGLDVQTDFGTIKAQAGVPRGVRITQRRYRKDGTLKSEVVVET